MTGSDDGARTGMETRERRGGTSVRRRRLAALGLAMAVGMVPAHWGGAQSEQPPRLEPAAVELTGSFDATPSRQVYAAIADQAGLEVRFDSNTRNPSVSIDLSGLSPQAALDRVALVARHFHVPVDARTVFVADDTPQNRKLYEPTGIRSYALRHAEPKEVMTALRTLIDVRRLMPTDEPARVTVRDTYPKLAAATRIVAMLDREPWDIRLRVELLPAEAGVLREIEEAGGEVSAERAQALRRAPGAPLAAGLLGLVGARKAEWKVRVAGDRFLSLGARARLTPDDDRVQLDLDLSTASAGGPPSSGLELVSSYRIAPGRSLVIPIPPAMGRPDAPRQPALLLLTPEVLARGELDAEPYETFLVGTESNVTVGDP